MNLLSYILIPVMIIAIISYVAHKKTDVYASFIEGAKEGIQSSINIFPFTISMILAVNIFLNSNILDTIFAFLTPHLGSNIPLNIIPMAILRPISGSASLVIMADIFKTFGPDSLIGRIASTLQGSIDTTFYVITLYFGSVGITKIRYALKAGLLADLIKIGMSFIIVYLLFS